MARYLKSLVTGVVLPYVEASLKSADIRLMDPRECAEYEASVGKTSEPAPDAAPTPEVLALRILRKPEKLAFKKHTLAVLPFVTP